MRMQIRTISGPFLWSIIFLFKSSLECSATCQWSLQTLYSRFEWVSHIAEWLLHMAEAAASCLVFVLIQFVHGLFMQMEPFLSGSQLWVNEMKWMHCIDIAECINTYPLLCGVRCVRKNIWCWHSLLVQNGSMLIKNSSISMKNRAMLIRNGSIPWLKIWNALDDICAHAWSPTAVEPVLNSFLHRAAF